MSEILKQRVYVDASGRLGNQLFQASAGLAVMDRLDQQGIEAELLWINPDAVTEQVCEVLGIDFRSVRAPVRTAWRKLMTPGSPFRGAGDICEAVNLRRQNRFFQVVDDAKMHCGFRLEDKRPFLLRGNFGCESLASQALLRRPLSTGAAVPSPLGRELLVKRPIIVHVRLGDFLEAESRKIWGVLSPNYYSRALDILAGDASMKGREIWLFSDDLPLASALLESTVSIDYCVDSTQWGMNSAQTLTAMAMGGALIMSASTFSLWAGYLAGDECQVVAPTPLSRTSPDDRPAATHWLRLKAEYI